MKFCESLLELFENSNCLCKDRKKRQKVSEASLNLVIEAPANTLSEESNSISVRMSPATKKMQAIPNHEMETADLLTQEYTYSSYGEEARSLILAIEKNDTEFVKSILTSSDLHQYTDSDGFSLLHRAKSILTSSDLHQYTDSDGFSLLHRAVFVGNPNTVSILAKKVNLNTADDSGRTALHYACMQSKAEITEILLQLGCDTEIIDNYGKTAFNYSENQPEIREIFNSFSQSRRVTEKAFNIVQTNDNGMDRMIEELKQNRILKRLRKVSRSAECVTGINCLSNYKVIKVVGKGSYSKVFLVEDKRNGKEYALKVMKKSKIFENKMIDYVKTEKHILSTLRSPFIISLISSFQTKTSLLLLMQYCHRGSLGDRLQNSTPIPANLVKLYACEIILALECLHKNKFIYRDLKPSNILVNEDGHIMVSDFGLSKRIETQTYSFCGSIGYVAPEISAEKPYGYEVDWYMLGLTLFEMSTGCPFYLKNDKVSISDPLLYDLIEKLLENIQNKRLGFYEDASEVKRHNYFKGVDWEKVMKKEVQPFNEDESLRNSTNWIHLEDSDDDSSWSFLDE
ncbi:hypothetical protein SteCoe_27196 [Stentor coeruleus]|uniref:Protein kinase domain-containing protein n=1 Tax=Stentor coeruleus TaxID=5963 RepID=A0A1R2BBD6_9CILI|nr:hypothetical protein SteCoe_27196 [Stentor coeruleus]